MDKIFCN